ncbi:roadblock/LC7 domain-containing protein [Streptomyces sp. NBC_00285]|uniref:roadblock/LC7 domain-containing protein n=1 Tax=Streptomyces sp. NBC_00285 TaxID=2975700 RepID=UPI002E291B70|nr:roadblock/LC7 domain-containing protein [Streptomyces sp. NBC_00285]
MAAAQDGILEELRRLRARVPQLTGALAADVDGLVLAQDTPGVDPETVAALTGATRALAAQLADETGQGDLRELLVRGVYGYVATYAAGAGAVVTLLAQDRVNVGRLHLEGRRAGARIGELVDFAATDPTGPTGPTEQSERTEHTETTTKAPAKPAPARARAARTSRAKPTDTRATATAPTVARTTTES